MLLVLEWMYFVNCFNGTTLIIGLIAFVYSEDIKELAILLCLGARRDDLVSIYLLKARLLGYWDGIVFCFSATISKPN